MKSTALINPEVLIEELQKSIQTGIDSWIEAGRALVQLTDSHGMSLESICDIIGSPMVTVSVLTQFERIGRNQVIPALLVADYPASKALQKLPISEQKRISEQGVEMMVLRNGKPDTLIVQAQDLTRDQCKQVFATESVRSLPAQRAWIESRAAEIQAQELAQKAAHTPWIVRNGKVIFRDACELTRHELSLILTQLA